MDLLYVYWGLLISGFLAGSILPIASEGALLYALTLDGASVGMCLSAVTLGNFLGGCLTFYLGWVANGPRIERFLAKRRNRYWSAQVKRWGSSLLLLSWVPVIGDVMVLACGILRTSVRWGLPLMFAGKLARYAFVAWAFSTYNT